METKTQTQPEKQYIAFFKMNGQEHSEITTGASLGKATELIQPKYPIKVKIHRLMEFHGSAV